MRSCGGWGWPSVCNPLQGAQMVPEYENHCPKEQTCVRQGQMPDYVVFSGTRKRGFILDKSLEDEAHHVCNSENQAGSDSQHLAPKTISARCRLANLFQPLSPVRIGVWPRTICVMDIQTWQPQCYSHQLQSRGHRGW